ncbi:MAG: tetratricopeptide repeat protein, partial [Chloroflexota bacterium]|nr:tetratricopeptide repeat protein [Chloroflexota bacterium]
MPSASSPKRMPIPLTPPNRGNTASSGLPAPLTPLLGRSREITRIRSLLDGDGTRMVTLTGPGGIGKTRLALEVASQVQGDFAHGVCFVPLAAIRDPEFVASTIAQTLGVRDSDDRSAADVLATALRAQHLLLVLDNLEQVLEVAPWLADLLERCPRLKALITSRIPLRVRGEQRFSVPPLPVPDTDRRQSFGALTQYAAVDLFIDRAHAVLPNFALNEANAEDVAEICRRLDGLPLAIELAAASVNVLSPAAILARMTYRLTPLAGTMQAVPARHQTMRATIAWSYDLLTAEEQTLFRRLAIFSDGFTLDAAEVVVITGNGDSTGENAQGNIRRIHEPTPSVLDRIASLVDQSLIQPLPTAHGETRFGMLETIREYGLDQLSVSGEFDQVAGRHAGYFLALAERAAPHLTGPEQAVWLNQLESARSDLRAAFAWLSQHGDPGLSLRLATALWRFGYTRGYLRETRDWLDEALTQSPAPTTARAAALNGAGLLASAQGDPDTAHACHREALHLTRVLGDDRNAAVALNGLGNVAAAKGDRPLATQRYEHALRLFRDTGDRRGAAGVLTNVGNLHWDTEDLAGARSLHEEARTLYESIGERRGLAWSASNLGSLVALQGDATAGIVYLSDALTLYRELGDQSGIATTLEGFAEIANAREQDEREAMLLAAAATIRQVIGVPVPASDRPRYGAAIGALRDRLGASFDPAWAAGQVMTLDEAAALAIATTRSPRRADLVSASSDAGSGASPSGNSHGLSPRELEV